LIRRRAVLFSVLIGSSILGYFVSICEGSFRLPWGGSILFTSVVFVGLGYLFNRSSLCRNLTSTQTWSFMLLALAVSVPTALLNGRVWMYDPSLGNYFLFYTSSITGIAFIYLCSRAIVRNSSLEYFGRHSLSIMCIHWPILVVVSKLLSAYTRAESYGPNGTVLEVIAAFAITLALSILFTEIIERYAPFMLGRSSPSMPA
jgi:acyltransferase